MDNLSHSLTGLMLARAAFHGWCPRAVALVMLGANAPDVDVVAAVAGSIGYLEWHRHITHSLAAAPLVAMLPVLLVRAFSRAPFLWGRAYVASVTGVLSHVLMDWTNTYGTRLLLPFSDRWYRLDISFVVDAAILLALVLATIWPALSRLVSAEIGAQAPAGRGWAVTALLFVLSVYGARFVLHERALAVLDARLYEGQTPRRVAAFPTPFQPFRWIGLVETDSFYALRDVNLLGTYDPFAGRLFYKAEPGPALDAAMKDDVVRRFLRFSQFPLWRVSPAPEPEGAFRVDVMDLRFGWPPAERFITTVIVDSGGRVLESRFRFGGQQPLSLE